MMATVALGDAAVERRKQRRKNHRGGRGTDDDWTVASPGVYHVDTCLLLDAVQHYQALVLRVEEHRLAGATNVPDDIHHLQRPLLEHLPAAAAFPLQPSRSRHQQALL